MTYKNYEESQANAQPIEGYDIAMGETSWQITPNAVAFVYDEKTYYPTVCGRSEIKQTGKIPKDGIEVKLPRGHALGAICIAGAPEEEVTITIYRGHDEFFVTYFQGFLTSVKIDNNGVPICYFEPRSSDLPFIGGRRRCMRLCGHKLYGYRCGLDKDDYKVEGTIDTIEGMTITASEFGDADVPEIEIYGDLTALDGCLYDASSYLNPSSTPSEAFDNQLPPNNYWAADGPANQWVSCQWTSGKIIRTVKIQPCHAIGWSKFNPRHIKIEGSNNGSDWIKVPIVGWLNRCSVYNTDEAELEEINNYYDWAFLRLNNSTSYTYYRVYCYDNWGSASGMCIAEIEMMENDNANANFAFGGGGEIVVGTARRAIIKHYGDTIIISRPFGSNVEVDSAFVAYKGCDHLPNTCLSKFDNILNYGGQQFLPIKNHYTGNLIY